MLVQKHIDTKNFNKRISKLLLSVILLNIAVLMANGQNDKHPCIFIDQIKQLQLTSSCLQAKLLYSQ